MKYICSLLFIVLANIHGAAGQRWKNVDSLYGPLPSSVHVFYTDDAIDTAAFRAFYVTVAISDRELEATTDTTWKRRLTPTAFYERNGRPLVVMNGTFFSFETNGNLNVVMRDGEMLARNQPSIKRRGMDTGTYFYPLKSALGISRERKPDVAWLYTGTKKWPMAFQRTPCKTLTGKDSVLKLRFSTALHVNTCGPQGETEEMRRGKKWKMQTAIGGGPVLLQDGALFITNDQERIFTGNAFNEKHPRTAMGYTGDGKLILLVIEGRNPGVAGGATLTQTAIILQRIGCVEALNLDGGGSSCLLVNGRETIRPSDKTGQRPVPAVFMVQSNQNSKGKIQKAKGNP